MECRFDEMRLARDLPTPSAVGLKILELTSSTEYDQSELVGLISGDPALSGRVLRLANAANRDGGERVTSVQQAAMRLGSKAVRNVALGFSLLETRLPEASRFNTDSFWSQSLASAVATQVLAKATRNDSASLFTLGLLSGIGRLALACVHPERYGRICADPRSAAEASMLQLEWRTFEIDHLEVGACLLEDWGLPEQFSNTLHQISPRKIIEGDKKPAWAAILIAGRLIGRVLSPHPDDPLADRGRALAALPSAIAQLGLPEDSFTDYIMQASTNWLAWATFTGIRPLGPELGDLSLALVQAVDQDPLPVPFVGRRSAPERDLFAEEEDDIFEDDPVDTLRPGRVLLVDDDSAMLRLLALHLEKEGFEVFMATEGSVAMELAMYMQPEVVIIDWCMPGMSGSEFLHTLRKSVLGRRVYAIVISGQGDDERALEAFAVGVDDFIAKPINQSLFAARVRVGCRVVAERQAVERSERANLRRAAEMGLMGRRLRSAALTDALTGIANRRHGMQLLTKEWERSSRGSGPLSVVAIDIDHFKEFNDRAGHDIGDAVLREVADTLADNCRTGDAVARMGGEEFLCIVAGGSIDVASICAERLRLAVDQLSPVHIDVPLKINISLGVAQREPWMQSVDDLMREADKALYEAKGAGRNCVRVAGDSRGSAASA